MTKREQLWTIELGQHQLSSLRHDAPMTEFRSLSETDVDTKGSGILATFTQNDYGLESAKPDLQSTFKKPGGDTAAD